MGTATGAFMILPDEGQTCADRLRVIPGVLYSIWVERTADDKYVASILFCRPRLEKDGFRWRLPGGNALDKEGRLAGVFDGLDAESTWPRPQ